MVAVKGTQATLKAECQNAPSFFDFDAVPPPNLIHSNEKPLALMKKLLQDYSREGNGVIDPFAGSFVVAEACKQLKRPYIAIERDEIAYLKGCKRFGFKEEDI